MIGPEERRSVLHDVHEASDAEGVDAVEAKDTPGAAATEKERKEA